MFLISNEMLYSGRVISFFVQPVVVTIKQEVDVTSVDGKKSPV